MKKFVLSLFCLCLFVGCDKWQMTRKDMTSPDDVVLGYRFGLRAPEGLVPKSNNTLREQIYMKTMFLERDWAYVYYTDQSRLLYKIEITAIACGHRDLELYNDGAGSLAKYSSQRKAALDNFKNVIASVESLLGISMEMRDVVEDDALAIESHASDIINSATGANDKYWAYISLDGWFTANITIISKRITKYEDEIYRASRQQR